MKDETAVWLEYAAENLASAQILLDSGLFNSCLQNVQHHLSSFQIPYRKRYSGIYP